MREKVKGFCKYNLCVLIYLFCVLFCELISICFIGCIPFLTNPLYSLALFFFLVSLTFIVRKTKTKMVLTSVLFFVQIVMNIGFIYLYDSNGTFFEWSMLNQRSDAFGTIESLSLRWGLVAVLLSVYAMYITGVVLIHKFVYKNEVQTYKMVLASRIVTICVLCVASLATLLTPMVNALLDKNVSYIDKYLYGSAENKYQQMGISANAVYELFNGTIANLATDIDDDGIEAFIKNDGDKYLETSEYHGISEGNNLVYILVESFEWYAFLDCVTKEQSEILYPNSPVFTGLVPE